MISAMFWAIAPVGLMLIVGYTTGRLTRGKFDGLLFFRDFLDLNRAIAETLFRAARKRPVRVSRPIGSIWNSMVRAVFRKKTYEASFQPMYWDLVNEEQELLAEGRKWKARWLKFCAVFYYLAEVRRILLPIEKLFSWFIGVAS